MGASDELTLEQLEKAKKILNIDHVPADVGYSFNTPYGWYNTLDSEEEVNKEARQWVWEN